MIYLDKLNAVDFHVKHMKITDSLRKHLAERNVTLIEETTPKVIETYNRLYNGGRRVAGGFHVGC